MHLSRALATLLVVIPATVLCAPSPLDAAHSHSSAGGTSLNNTTPDVAAPAKMTNPSHGHHMHNGPALSSIDEAEILWYHPPTPPSYWQHDFGSGQKQYSGWMVLHILTMGFSFFVALPAAISLRSVKNTWHTAVMISFYASSALGCIFSAIYTKLTPNLYDGSKHSVQGYWILALASLLSLFDLSQLIRRVISYARSGDRFSLRSFWTKAVLGHESSQDEGPSHEYFQLMSKEPEELHDSPTRMASEPSSPVDDEQTRTVQWAVDAVNRRAHGHQRTSSAHSDRTLLGLTSPSRGESGEFQKTLTVKESLVWRLAEQTISVVERVLVFAGFMQVLSGIVVYTGGCRVTYLNGCLAHLIKGGIFWCYGLASFARFLGAFSERGWAWNQPTLDNVISAEFVECFVIFFYGVTNTWMERFDAKPGDPYTTKQLQHISIAVMFWFAGIIGMGLESNRVRRWIQRPSEASQEEKHTPSFNPFPALVIGVTGAAMSAHAQTYVFQVQIHALWGNLLVAFSVLRCVTYFFVWVRPPRTTNPSRPPSEALSSFFLACGGLVFMLSTEEVTFAAMRQGRDDMMFFLNLAVAITCLALCWTFAVVSFNGWLHHRALVNSTTIQSYS